MHIGNYPILAIVIEDLPVVKKITVDCSEYGTFLNEKNNNNGHNTHSTIETDYGTVYYWNLAEGRFNMNPIPTDQSFNMSLKLKIADLEYPDGVSPYAVKWMKSFRNEAELIKYLEEN